MDIKVLFIAFAIFAIAFIIKHTGKSPDVIGKAGEHKVSNILNSLPREYKILNNVILPNQKGTSQIDHIIVCPYGIFVIETKNYEGWIFGAENSEKWKQTFRTTSGHFFYNPIKQNWGHIYTLSSFLNIDKRVFKPIVVFSNRSRLNVEATVPVICMSQLKREVLSYKQEIIPREKVDLIYNKIVKTNLVGSDNERKHIQTVRTNLESRQRALQKGKCPKCGNDLVLRNGKYGNFYGCSNYPKCRFTQKV